MSSITSILGGQVLDNGLDLAGREGREQCKRSSTDAQRSAISNVKGECLDGIGADDARDADRFEATPYGEEHGVVGVRRDSLHGGQDDLSEAVSIGGDRTQCKHLDAEKIQFCARVLFQQSALHERCEQPKRCGLTEACTRGDVRESRTIGSMGTHNSQDFSCPLNALHSYAGGHGEVFLKLWMFLVAVYISAVGSLGWSLRRVTAMAAFVTLLASYTGTTSADALRYRQLTSADGIPLNVVEAGRADNPSILLLHGFSQSHMSWASQLNDPRLLNQYHIVAMDLRGHGGSGKPWTADAYLEAGRWANDIQVVIRELGLQAPLVVGWSFGGFVLLDYVRVHGTRDLGAFMLVGSHGGLLEMSTITPVDTSGNLEAQLRDAREFMGRMSARPLSAEEVEHGVASFMMLPAYVRTALKGKNYDNAALATKLDLPVRFLVGSEEPFVDQLLVQELAAELQCADVVVQAGAGHMPFAEDPESFGESLLELATAARSHRPSPGTPSCPLH